MKIAIIFIGATSKQNQYWWPSFNTMESGYEHDLILVHRNTIGLNTIYPDAKTGKIIFENKILQNGEIAHKAYGAYRYFFNKYKDDYDAFAFISDDVYLRRDNWLLHVVDMFNAYPKLGMISPMLHNNPPHARAPIWFGRTESLSKVDWNFTDDHDGEMTMADRVTETGYFVAQIGHKVDFAYDPDWDTVPSARVCGSPHPNQWIEKIWFGEIHFGVKFTPLEIKGMNYWKANLLNSDKDEFISDPRINSNLEGQNWSVLYEIQPYHGLIYNKSLHIVKQERYEYDEYIKPHFFHPSQQRYICKGINNENPIAILK